MPPSMSNPYQAILLAAGSSRRFGDNKLLARLDNNLSLLENSCIQIQKASLTPLVVIRDANSPEAQLLTKIGIQFIENPDADTGLSSSIRIAIESTAPQGTAGWLIFLADMPCIRHQTIRQVHDTAQRKDKIIYPTFNGQQGHPVAFPTRFRTQLLNLSGDRGARSILKSHQGDCLAIETNDPGILLDLDKIDDLAAINAQMQACQQDGSVPAACKPSDNG